MNVQPIRDLVLVERLDGHGIETVTPGGIIIPATCEARAKTKSDTWKGRVLAKGPDAPSDLSVGDGVIVHAWADGDGSVLYTGVPGRERHHLFIKPDDIVCVYDEGRPS